MHDNNPNLVETKSQLDDLARRMLAQASPPDTQNVFSATGYRTDNISILHQQARCTHLAWALHQSNRINPGDIVVIAGAGFSGLMLSVLLSATTDCIVYICEAEKRPLHKYRSSSHRFLGPNLNNRDLPKDFNPATSTPFFSPPIFEWAPDAASEVCHRWLREFDHYEAQLPIWILEETAVASVGSSTGARPLNVTVTGSRRSINADLLIDATGFGDETNPFCIPDFSYWGSGHDRMYDSYKSQSRVLISGCGDSGIIEALHYLYRGFRHQDILAAYPYGYGLESYIQPQAEASEFMQIFHNPDSCDPDEPLLSELVWYINYKWNIDMNPQYFGWIKSDRVLGLLFSSIETEILTRNIAIPSISDNLDLEKLRGDLQRIPPDDQLSIRDSVAQIAETVASHAIAKVMDALNIQDLPHAKALAELCRDDTQVTLNGTTPTPYTRSLSPMNWYFVRHMQELHNFTYFQGKVVKIARTKQGYEVEFDGGSTQQYDRVCTRYGPGDFGATPRVLAPIRSKSLDLDYLLFSPTIVPRSPTNPTSTYQHPATSLVCRKIGELKSNKSGGNVQEWDKRLYKWSFDAQRIIGNTNVFKGRHEKYVNAEKNLSDALKSNSEIRYVKSRLPGESFH